MANKSKFNGWTAVLNSVKTPLGFFALLALIVDGVLIASATATDKVSVWVPVGILGFLIVCVFAIILVKPLALYHPKDWPAQKKTVTVNLIFPIESIQVDLDINQCALEVRDQEGRRKHMGTPNLTFGHGGWSFRLIEKVEPFDSVRLELIERNGRKWRVNPFAPYETEAKVLQLT